MSGERTQESVEEDFGGGELVRVDEEGEGIKEVGKEETLGAVDKFGLENEVGEGEEESYPVGIDRETMSVSSSNTRIKNMSIDRLSALPDSLLIHILSFLYVKRAAITSVLSKRWQYIWAELPGLHFWESSRETEKISKFVAMVHRTLVIRSGKYLEEFHVHFRYDESLASDVDAWVEFAVKNKAKKIALRLISEEDFYTLPEMLYSNSLLTELSLQDCIVAPERTIEWKSLTKLDIVGVELRQSVVENILSGCPLLYSLDLSECWGFNRLNINSPSPYKLRVCDCEEEDNGPLLEISAPYIHSLDICLYPERRKLRLTNISSLVTASIELDGYDWEASFASADVNSNVKELIEKTKHVKELNLGNLCFQVLSVMVANGWQLPQSRRVSLTVTAFPDYNHNLSGILGLLDSSPNLEKLYVDGFEISWDPMFWRPPTREDLDCNLLHLKTVEIKRFAEPSLGGDPMLMLARILLKRAVVLEEMLIIIDVEDTDYFIKICQKLLAYPRSSEKAEVLLLY